MRVGMIPRLVLLMLLPGIPLSGCKPKVYTSEERARMRPATVNQEHVLEWSCALNGVPFEGHAHTLKAGEKVHVTGHVKLVDGAIPLMTVPQFTIALRPAGKLTQKEWTAADGGGNSTLEFSAGFTGKQEERKELKADPELYANEFPPGEYDARLYFRIWDYRLGKSWADLLGTSKITIVK